MTAQAHRQAGRLTAAGLVGGLLGLLIVAAIALVLFSRPRSDPGHAGPRSANVEGSASAPSDRSPTDQPLSVPLTHEEQIREDLSRKRIPYYRYLHDNFGDLVDRFSVLDDPDTLDLVLRQSDDATLNRLMTQAIAPRAGAYGFRRVRFYVRNPNTAVTPFSVIAEGTDDGAGHWSTFKK